MRFENLDVRYAKCLKRKAGSKKLFPEIKVSLLTSHISYLK
jgi:hypothetical protein